MNRREFLKVTAAGAAALTFPSLALGQVKEKPSKIIEGKKNIVYGSIKHRFHYRPDYLGTLHQYNIVTGEVIDGVAVMDRRLEYIYLLAEVVDKDHLAFKSLIKEYEADMKRTFNKALTKTYGNNLNFIKYDRVSTGDSLVLI